MLSIERQKVLTTIHINIQLQLDSFISQQRKLLIERQKVLTIRHINIQLDPFVSQLKKLLIERQIGFNDQSYQFTICLAADDLILQYMYSQKYST